MKSSILLFSLITILTFVGCSTDDSFLINEEYVIDSSEKETSYNIEHNRWTYVQMNHHYLWNNEIPDSVFLDFSIEPSLFFRKLLVQKDRFSWCEVNLDYTSRGVNNGSTLSFDSVYSIHNKRIGYAIYDRFDNNADIRSFAIRMKNAKIDDLILDLRYNPGGYVYTCNELASFFVPVDHLGKLYQQQVYNKILTREKSLEYKNNGVDSVFLRSGSWFETWGLNLNRITILTTKNTASASESLIIGLRPYMRVITIGTTSCGKDVGSYTIADNRYNYQLQPITFKYYNALNESTPTTGIVPDIYVEDDLDHQRGDTNEALLKAAIEYLTGETQNEATKARSVSQPKIREVGRSSIEIKNNL